jgi:hypothetical protein
MTNATDQTIARQIANSEMRPLIIAEEPSEKISYESTFCYRLRGGLGTEFTVDWSTPFIHSALWAPTEPRSPIGYRNANGVEVKVLIHTVLSRVGIDPEPYIATMRKLGPTEKDVPSMIDLSINVLLEHLGTFNSNMSKIFRECYNK